MLYHPGPQGSWGWATRLEEAAYDPFRRSGPLGHLPPGLTLPRGAHAAIVGAGGTPVVHSTFGGRLCQPAFTNGRPNTWGRLCRIVKLSRALTASPRRQRPRLTIIARRHRPAGRGITGSRPAAASRAQGSQPGQGRRARGLDAPICPSLGVFRCFFVCVCFFFFFIVVLNFSIIWLCCFCSC